MTKSISFIDEKREEILTVLKDLIKARTENPPGDTSEGIKVIGKVLEKYGIDYRIVEPSSGKMNLIAELGDGEPVLILNGHVDVVPAGDGWSVDPFSGIVEGDKIYGRGSSDMKSGVIALLYAFLAHRDIRNGKLVLTIVADEETGGREGTKYLLENKLVHGDACLIAEPSGRLGPHVYDIVAGEKGALWLKVRTSGKAAHGSLPMLGDNAIKKMAKIVTELPMLIPIKSGIPENAKTLIEHGKEALKSAHPEAPKALDHLTINVGTIKGGKKTNIVADDCEITLDIRVPIGLSTDTALREVEKIIRQNLCNDVDLEVIDRIEPSYTPANHSFTKIVREVAKKYLGYEPLTICMAATSDARIFRHHNIPTINFGPGYLEKAHTKDEFVYINDVFLFAKIYVEIIERFLKH